MIEDSVPMYNTVILPNVHASKSGEMAVFYAVEVKKLDLLNP